MTLLPTLGNSFYLLNSLSLYNGFPRSGEKNGQKWENIGHFFIENREKFGCKIDQIKSLYIVKFLNFRTPEKVLLLYWHLFNNVAVPWIYCNDLKFSDRQVWANSVDSDQTALLVYTVCHSVSIILWWSHVVQISECLQQFFRVYEFLRIFTVWGPKDADNRMINRVDIDQTAPRGARAVWSVSTLFAQA